MCGFVAESITAEALRSILHSSDCVVATDAGFSAEVDGVGVAFVSSVGKSLWVLVRPASLIRHAGVGLVVD